MLECPFPALPPPACLLPLSKTSSSQGIFFSENRRLHRTPGREAVSEEQGARNSSTCPAARGGVVPESPPSRAPPRAPHPHKGCHDSQQQQFPFSDLAHPRSVSWGPAMGPGDQDGRCYNGRCRPAPAAPRGPGRGSSRPHARGSSRRSGPWGLSVRCSRRCPSNVTHTQGHPLLSCACCGGDGGGRGTSSLPWLMGSQMDKLHIGPESSRNLPGTPAEIVTEHQPL